MFMLHLVIIYSYLNIIFGNYSNLSADCFLVSEASEQARSLFLDFSSTLLPLHF